MAGAAPTGPPAEPLSAPGRRRAARPAVAREVRSGLTPIEIGALVFTILWLGLVLWFFMSTPEDQVRPKGAATLGLVTTILGIFLPIALVWVAASAARTAQAMRVESARLRAAMDTMRDAHVAVQLSDAAALRREIDDRLEAVTQAQAVLAAELAALRDPVQPVPMPAAPPRPDLAPPKQPALALDTGPDVEALPPDDFIRALNFPENERDQEGFDVLRRALAHHDTARLVSAAQDMLTLLAQDGIYMDDLTVHRADAILWRAFADGMHGSDVAALGGIRDRSSLALTAGRMKDDSVFRDAVHHFLRTFDQVFSTFTQTATDGEIMAFANTRTARAFMLCARVSGTFD